MSSDGTIIEQISLIQFNNLGVFLSVEIEPSVGKFVSCRMRSLVIIQPSLVFTVRC